MSAVVLAFPDRRGNRPASLNPPADVATKVKAYCWKLGLSTQNRYTVMRAVEHWQQIGLPDVTVASRGMAMALRLQLSHEPPPGGAAA